MEVHVEEISENDLVTSLDSSIERRIRFVCCCSAGSKHPFTGCKYNFHLNSVKEATFCELSFPLFVCFSVVCDNTRGNFGGPCVHVGGSY